MAVFSPKDTLLFRVFKSKFFLSENIFDAVVPVKCSYAWRSILQATEVFQKDAIWRVGDGLSIKVWEHRWLTNPAHSKILSPRLNSAISRVSELLLPNAQSWNVDLIDHTFMSWEAKEIKQIHVSGFGQEDAYVWLFTSDGEYFVRSAYHMLALGLVLAEQTSTSSGDQKVWKGIWCIRAPNKIRHFIWRAVKDSVPTKENLHKRHIPLDVICSLCDEHQETTLHAL